MIIGVDANEANLTRNRVGINQYAFNLLHALYNLKSGHEFVIYLKTPPLNDLPPARPGWSYRVIPFPVFWTQTRLPFDLYTHSPRPAVFLSITHYAPRQSPVPNVITIMDLGFLQSPEQFTRKDFNQLKSWTGYSIRQAKKIVAISEHTRRDILENFRRESTVIYPGYDQQLFRPTRNPKTLQKYGISEPYLFFIGSLRPSKNIDGLIKAFSQLQVNGYRLVIAGKKGWLYNRIFQTVNSLNLENRIIFTGFIEESEVPVLMTHAVAFVMPSFYEGFGIPVAEAMACGTPVVVSRIASLPEVAGPAGIYVDPKNVDSIVDGLKIALGPDRKKYIRLGFSQVKKFNWDDSARRILTVLESAVE